MQWIKVFTNLRGHPKLIKASDSAFRLFVESLLYCRSDPAASDAPDVPRAVVDSVFFARNLKKAARELERVGLWKRVKGGWDVPSFRRFNLSDEYFTRQAELGRKGGIASWNVRRAKRNRSEPFADPSANAEPTAEQIDRKIDRKRDEANPSFGRTRKRLTPEDLAKARRVAEEASALATPEDLDRARRLAEEMQQEGGA